MSKGSSGRGESFAGFGSESRGKYSYERYDQITEIATRLKVPLTHEEKIAVALYTGGAEFGKGQYQKINNPAQSGDKAYYERAQRVLNSALKKMPKVGGIVLRGSLAKKEFKVGETIKYNRFISTTKNSAQARSFALGQTLYIMKTKSGRRIAPFATHPGEKEILHPTGTRWKVTRVIREKKTRGRSWRRIIFMRGL